MKSDSQLQSDVQDEFKWDPKVDHSQIGVTAKGGVVTLSGFVSDYTQKMAAEKAARRVMGVSAIAEEIEVRYAGDLKTSDTEIAQRIVDMFDWDVTIPHDKLAVKVEKGWVTLTGTVEWNHQKEAAQKAAGRIGGVMGVSNLLLVRKQTTAFDVRERIIAAFKRSSVIDAYAIDIKVDGDTVKMSGKLHGWNERSNAEKAAWSAPGVTKVEDNIVLA